MSRPRIVMVVGTRPDAIKSAPVYLELQKYRDQIEILLVSTGQHREMLDQVFATFGIEADGDLDIMQHGQTLAQITCRAMVGLDEALASLSPDFLLAQGDTTTTFVAALTTFYRRIPFGHIEAGLRTHHIDDPFPEEFNRRAAALVATQHYAPTLGAKENLLQEGIEEDRIFVTGNTGIDAVRYVAQRYEQTWYTDWPGRVLLLTTHRRENWGERQRNIAGAALRIVEQHPDVLLVVPMHKNPIVRETLIQILGNQARIELIEPPEYAQFVKLMERSFLILTDSGGVQEEAPALGKPVLVLRETTERPEGVVSGNAMLTGTDEDRVCESTRDLLRDPVLYHQMAESCSPYGDGLAAQRICSQVASSMGLHAESIPPWDSA